MFDAAINRCRESRKREQCYHSIMNRLQHVCNTVCGVGILLWKGSKTMLCFQRTVTWMKELKTLLV